jgi:hypothetical protein
MPNGVAFAILAKPVTAAMERIVKVDLFIGILLGKASPYVRKSN